MPLAKPITISNWPDGIATSPAVGFSQMYNVDIFNVDGVARPNFALQNQIDSPAGVVTTATVSGNTLTLGTTIRRGTGTLTSTGRAFTVNTSIGGLTAGTVYYAIDNGANSILVATTLDNALTNSNISLTGSSSTTLSTIDPALVTGFVDSPITGSKYAQDSVGRVWELQASIWYLITGNNVSSGANGNGIAVWKNYLVVFRNNNIDLYGALTTTRASRAWTNGWQTTLQGAGDPATHCPFVSANNILYFADFNDASTSTISGANVVVQNPYINQINEVLGQKFNPATASTYNYQQAAFYIPRTSAQVNCMMELNYQMYFGMTTNQIYIWDESSPTVNFMPLAERNVSAMLNVNNVLYIACGRKGNVYYSYGTYALKLIDFSDYLSGYPEYTVTISAMTTAQGRIFFALTGDTGSGSPLDQVSGIYSMNLQTSQYNAQIETGTYNLDFIPSGGLGVQCQALLADDDGLNTGQWVYSSWYSPTAGTYGIDYIGNAAVEGPIRSTGLCQIVTALFQIANFDDPAVPEKFIVNLAKPLNSGESVSIAFRNGSNASWTPLKTLTVSGQQGFSGSPDLPISGSAFMQVALYLNSAPSTTQLYDCPELREVTIY